MSLETVPELPVEPKNQRFWKMKMPLSWVLALTFGGLVAASVWLVLSFMVAVNFFNTFSLLNDKAIALLETMEGSIRAETRKAELSVTGIATLYKRGSFEVDNPDSFRQILETTLASSDIIEAIMVVDVKGDRTGLAKAPDRSLHQINGKLPSVTKLPDAVRNPGNIGNDGVVWLDPVQIDGMLFHRVLTPLTRNDQPRGTIVAHIGRSAMDRVFEEMGERNDTTAFLMTHDNQVVGHSNLRQKFQSLPAFALNDFPDSVLQQFDGSYPADEFTRAAEKGIKVFESERGGGGHVFMIKELTGYSSQPYTLGAYFAKADVGSEVRRAMIAFLIGLAVLVVSVVVAVLIGRRLARPMIQVAETADHFSNFELDRIKTLPQSRVKEINNQVNALNSLHAALNEFTRYVPKRLVQRILTDGSDVTGSVEREVTIMFTDIVGFTSMSERMDAKETAALLNHHFELVCGAIEQSGGTVDKFMGDSVMAFWGAPDADGEHAANAIKAAGQIAKAISSDNEARRNNGEPPLQVRIGIHTGRVIVGNIGGGERQNYTVVGDTANTAQRLEQLGRDIIGDHEVIALMSDKTRDAAHAPEGLVSVGLWSLRGRETPVPVFALKAENAASPENVLNFPMISG